MEVRDGGALWSRRALYERLTQWISEGEALLIGIDHGFSFPEAYYQAYGLGSWLQALDDFVRHWPSDQDSVESLRGTEIAMKRQGNSRWRRKAETLARAKSVFHFDVPGSVAKSTHAGLPWLLKLKTQLQHQLHVWPFDGLDPMPGTCVMLEAYPSLWLHQLKAKVPSDLKSDQRDAFVVAKSLMEADATGLLEAWFRHPASRLGPEQIAKEGWILGVG